MQRAPASGLYRQAWRSLRLVLGLAMLFSAAINVLMLTGSVYMLQVYDRVLASSSVPTLVALFAIVVVLYGFLGVYDWLRSRILTRAALRLDQALGPAAFRSWLATRDGAATAEPLRDLETLRGFLSGPAVRGLFDLPWVPLYFVILFLVHPWLGAITLAGAAVVALAAGLSRALTQADLGRAMALDAVERGFAHQARRSGEEIGVLGMGERVAGHWRRLHLAALVAAQGAGGTAEAISAFSRSFRMLLQSSVLTVAALLVIQQQITAGMIVASSILSGRALAPIDQLIGQWRSIARAVVAHRRLAAFFAALPEPPARIDLPAPTGQISVARITKLVPGRQPAGERGRILNQVSFALEPGDGLGVIGNSASGKSTLARVLVGGWRPDAGEVRLDGATIDQWHPEALGRAIGYLPQTLEMLPGSIRDNIARFDTTARDEEVIAAARLAGVHDMILQLPDGYATRLEALERPLSGGQIQRLGLARAVFGQPRILVLDEPNSNLDVIGDNALTQAILGLRAAGSTVIVMAHRPSAIAAVNKILILHSGSVAAFGPKEEVLAAAMQQGSAAAGADSPAGGPPPVAAGVGAAAGPAAGPATAAAGTALPEPLRLRALASRGGAAPAPLRQSGPPAGQMPGQIAGQASGPPAAPRPELAPQTGPVRAPPPKPGPGSR